MTSLSEELASEGYQVEFVAVANHNAEDFINHTNLRIFKDDSPGKAAWVEMAEGAAKYDTFVYSKTGELHHYWDISEVDNWTNWRQDIRALVVAEGK